MTKPTITYGVPWQDDCNDKTGWTETLAGSTSSMSVDSGTIFNINTTVYVGDVYHEYDFTNISSTVNGKFYALYKTSDSTIKAKIVLVFVGGAGTQTILAETSNTDWTLLSADITTGQTIDKIRIYAAAATGNVYYHWVMIYKGTFILPDFKRFRVHFPIKTPNLGIPGSDTNRTQLLGRDNAEFTIEGTMQAGETWGSKTGAAAKTDVQTYGEYLYYVLREKKFQWFTSDLGNFKVTVDAPGFDFEQNDSSGQQRSFTLHFREYEAGDTSDSTFDDPVWYGEELT